jgi:hypothetical protein
MLRDADAAVGRLMDKIFRLSGEADRAGDKVCQEWPPEITNTQTGRLTRR